MTYDTQWVVQGLSVPSGINGFSGTLKKTYKINRQFISKQKINMSGTAFTYTGEQINPGKNQFVVTVNKQVLSSSDFEIVEYQNNVNVGTAKVVLRGIGGYGGTYTASFKIVQRPVENTIIYNGNGSTSGTMKNQMVKSTSFALSLNAYKRTGYVFNGWNTAEDGSGLIVEDGQVFTGELGDSFTEIVVLYAMWEKEVYTITYNKDGGVFNEGVLPKEEYTITDHRYVLPELSKSGYTFNGWYKDASYKTKVTSIEKGSTGNITLYAEFTVNR